MLIALALAAALQEPIARGEDCPKPELIRPAKPHLKPKPGLVAKHRRLFKSEPKVEEECDETPRLAPFTASIEPINDQFTPVPEMDLDISRARDVPMLDVPDVAEGPSCECFAPVVFSAVSVSSPVVYSVVGQTSAVPEFPSWVLMLGLAPFLYPAGRRGSSRFIKPRAS